MSKGLATYVSRFPGDFFSSVVTPFSAMVVQGTRAFVCNVGLSYEFEFDFFLLKDEADAGAVFVVGLVLVLVLV